MKHLVFIFVERMKQRKIFSFELISKDIYGDEKFTGRPSDLMLLSQTATRNDTVHMYMVT